MDSLTHAVMGVAIGELTLGRKIGKKALIWGAIVANIPDIDGVFQYLLSPATSALFHRGIMHSLLFLVLFAPLVAWAINRFHKGNKTMMKSWFGLVFLAWGSHLFVDIFNTYGTGLFEPFSHLRVSYDTIGISDIFFVLPLVVAAIISFINRTAKRKTPLLVSALSLLLSFGYLGYTVVHKHNVERFAQSQLAQQNIMYTRMLTSPLPITNFAWMVVAEDENGFWKGTYSTTTENTIHFDYIPKNHELASDIEDVKDFKKLQRFTKGYYTLRKTQNNNIIMSDLRFGSLTDKSANGTLGGGLNFTLQTNPITGKLIVDRAHPKRNVTPSNLKQYIKRISRKS